MTNVERIVQYIARLPDRRVKRADLIIPGMPIASVSGGLAEAIMRGFLRRYRSSNKTTWIEYIPQKENAAFMDAWQRLSGSRMPAEKPVGRIVRGVSQEEEDDEPSTSPLEHAVGSGGSTSRTA